MYPKGTPITLEVHQKALGTVKGISFVSQLVFRVFGVQLSESGIVDEILLGDFHYDAESNSQVQTFITKNLQRRKYSHVKLQIQTNYGNPQYTCLYRFRVHNKTPDTN